LLKSSCSRRANSERISLSQFDLGEKNYGSKRRMITPNRIHGTGILMAKGAEQSPVEYEVTAFEVNMIIRTAGWIEAGHDVLTSAQSASGALLKLTDGRIVDVSVGSVSVTGNPSRAELIVHDGLYWS
jgi:hypothetical protein